MCVFPMFRLARKSVLNFLLVDIQVSIAECRPEFSRTVLFSAQQTLKG